MRSLTPEKAMERSRLMRLIENFSGNSIVYCSLFTDYLLQSGVILPPAEVDQTVFIHYNGDVAQARVIALYFDRHGGMFDLDVETKTETTVGYKHVICKDFRFDDVGKTMFLTRRAAEEMLETE